MKKLSLSLLFAIMLLGVFAAAASAYDGLNDGMPNNPVEPTADNANETGTGADDNTGATKNDVLKSSGMTNEDGTVTTHKTHGEYQNNTNSCASCHQTHTSKGKQLLFADTTYQTCSACHDGTLGFYNVFESGANADTEGAGTFGGSHANNMSIHQSNDAVLVKAAPGGNNSGTGAWTASFNCASCHAPHGSYSDRLLHYNPNQMATTPMNIVTKANGDKVNLGGNRIDGLVPSTTKPDAGKYGLVIAESTDAADNIDGQAAKKLYLYQGTTKIEKPMLYGYASHGQPHFTHLTYKTKAVGTPTGWAGSEVQVSDTAKGLKYTVTADSSIVVWEKPAGTFKLDDGTAYSGTKEDLTAVKEWKDSTTRIEYGNADVYFSNEKGYFKALTPKGQDILNGDDSDTYGGVVGQVSLAYQVDMDLIEVADIDGLKIYKNNQSAYWTERTLGTPSTADKNFVGQGVALSNYCAACHTDYLAKSSTRDNKTTGTFKEAYRHTTNNASYTCARCHYAHGTDAELMFDAQGRQVKDLVAGGMDQTQAVNYMMDQNKSSALKKYTNMTVCWACHNSSKAGTIKNTVRPEDHPTGMPKDLVDYGGTEYEISR